MAVDENGNEIINTQPVENRSQERIKELSDKVELTAKERDEMKTLNESLTRKNTFLSGYSEVIAKFPAASEHRDAIEEKVLKGYTVEDATFAVLGPTGKLGNAPAPVPTNPAGGSAPTNIPQSGADKPIAEMTQAERRAKLEQEIVWT